MSSYLKNDSHYYVSIKHLYLVVVLIFNLWVILVISSSWMIFLAVLEMTIMVMMFLRLQPLRSDNKVLFRYFLFQTAASICVVAFFIGYFNIEFTLIVLIIKLILPPFHVWILIRIKFGRRWTFFWIMLIIKVPTFILFAILLNYYFLDIGLLLILFYWSAIISRCLLWSSSNLSLFVISSSFLHTLWTILSLLVRKNIFFCYYLFYSLVLFILLASIYRRFEFLLSNEWSWDIYFSLFIFSGAPPSFMFLIKWSLLFSLIELNFFLFLIALIISGVSLYLYFRIIFVIILRGFESVQIFKKSKLMTLFCLNLVGLVIWTFLLQLSLKFY